MGANFWEGTTIHRDYRLDELVPNGDYAAFVRKGYKEDRTVVVSQDPIGFTPLHVAAQFANVAAIQALLKLPRKSGVRDTLWRRDNDSGNTPLEMCEFMMRHWKESSERDNDIWVGYSNAALKSTLILRRAMGETVHEREEDYIRQRKWGCTCGKCLHGFLSARMCTRIHGEFTFFLFSW